VSISINNIEEFVTEAMLYKAQEIISKGVIESIEQYKTNEYLAIVSGTKNYSVNIVLDSKSNLFTHRCDCPYDASPICKHKLAVICHIKNSIKQGLAILPGILTQTEEVLNTYNSEQLRQLIIELIKQNHHNRRLIIQLLDMQID
jgi:uncharacterized Zn finger protein